MARMACSGQPSCLEMTFSRQICKLILLKNLPIILTTSTHSMESQV